MTQTPRHMTHTPEQELWADMQADAKANKPNANVAFNNTALTVAGVLCIGMTHDKTNGRYCCSYTQLNCQRLYASRRWDLKGRSLDGLEDLDLDTVQQGVRTI